MRKVGAPLAFFLALALAFHLPVLLTGRFFVAGDLLRTEYPWRAAGARPHNRYLNDSIHVAWPARKSFHDQITNGRLALWDPTIACGIPDYFMVLRRVLLPYRFVPETLLPPLGSLAVGQLLAMLAGGWFMARFLRRLGISPATALLGGAVWMFHGYTTLGLELGYEPVLFLFPGLLLAVTALVERPSGLRLAAAALLVTWTLVENLQHGVYVLLVAGAWSLLRVARRASWRERAGRLAALAGAHVLGAATAAFDLLPVGAFAEASQRVAPSFAELVAGQGPRFELANLLTLVVPTYWGSPVDWFYFTVGGHFSEVCGYVGLFPLLLAMTACALGARERSRPVLFFGAVAVVALLMAMGTWVLYPFYALLPGVGRFSAISRVLVAWSFVVVVLAAQGFDRLRAAAESWGAARGGRLLDPAHRAIALLAILTTLTTVVMAADRIGLEMQPAPDPTRIPARGEILWQVPGTSLALAVACAALVWLLAAARRSGVRRAALALLGALTVIDLAWFGFRYQPACRPDEVYPETPGIRFLRHEPGLFRFVALAPATDVEGVAGSRPVLFPNAATVFGLHDVGGYASLLFRRYVRLLDRVQARVRPGAGRGYVTTFFPISNPEPAFWGLLNVKYFVTPPDDPPPRPGLELAYAGEVRIWRNPEFLPRAFVVHRVLRVGPDPDAALEAVLDDRLDRARVAVVGAEARAGGVAADAGPPRPDATPVEVVEYAAGRVLLRAAPRAAGLLVFTESECAGWEATVDGAAAGIVTADAHFIGVPLAAGAHEIQLRFRPAVVRTGAAITGASLLALLAIVGVSVARARRRAVRP